MPKMTSVMQKLLRPMPAGACAAPAMTTMAWCTTHDQHQPAPEEGRCGYPAAVCMIGASYLAHAESDVLHRLGIPPGDRSSLATTSVDLHFSELTDLVGPWWPGTHPVGVPPHITLLYPWVSPVHDEAMAAVAEIAASTMSFDIRFDDVDLFESGVIFLKPDEDAPIRSLMTRLSGRFPETPLYGGAISAPVPHLTIARPAPDEDARAMRSRIFEALAPSLPLRVSVRALSVMEEGLDGIWSTTRRLPLLGST